MNQTIVFDAKLSREILKAIRYGMEVRLDTPLHDDDAEHLRGRLVDLKKAYLAKRRFIDEKRSDFGNFIFYQLLLEKYPEFEYRFDKHGRLRSNLYEFKVDGRLPSLLTMLLNERIGRLSELEKRYGRSAKFGALFASVEQLFQDATLVYPDSATFFRFLEALTLAAQGDEPLTVVSAICPDYSYTAEADTVRYTFESLGSQPGLAGNKFIAILPAVARCLDELGVRHEVSLFGGDFESLTFVDSSSSLKISQHDFIARVRQQIAAISGAVQRPVSQSFFFEVVGGQRQCFSEIYSGRQVRCEGVASNSLVTGCVRLPRVTSFVITTPYSAPGSL
jgi:hypothetical protein